MPLIAVFLLRKENKSRIRNGNQSEEFTYFHKAKAKIYRSQVLKWQGV
jgi:hypothetical protein